MILSARLFGCVILCASVYTLRSQTAPESSFLRFNGTDQCLVVPHHRDFSIREGESLTLTCRLSPDDFEDQYSIVSKGNLLIPGELFELYIRQAASSPNMGLRISRSAKGKLSIPYLTTLMPNRWVHFAWVYDAGTHTSSVYLDGVLLHTITDPTIGSCTLENTGDLMIGCGWSDAWNPTRLHFWPGLFDELRIWKRALPAKEVQEDRTAAKADTRNLVAWYDFEKIVCNAVKDLSGRGHHGQLHGYGILTVKNELPVGIGEKNERMVSIRIPVTGKTELLRNILVDLTGTKPVSDILAVHAYYNGSAARFDPKTAKLFGSAVPAGSRVLISGEKELPPGNHYIWITADISPLVREGTRLQVSVASFRFAWGPDVCVPYVSGTRTVLLANKLLFSAGDAGSGHYRIPAIVTARDGSLVTATDRRWNNPFDLPNHIDVVIRRSSDKGMRWSPPVTIAGEGTSSGYGDASLVLNRKNGEILCIFAGENGFFYSTAENPIRIFLSRSRDNGITWSKPTDLTPMIYGSECDHPVTRSWQGAFVSSGSATQLRNGRLMAAIAVRENSTRNISNFVIYSDDDGQTWRASVNRAAENGNEAKLVETVDGYVLMSIRNFRNRLFTLSKDQGMTWSTPFLQREIIDPYCNGDLIRYTAVPDGFRKNRLLHSIPLANSRRNVSVLLSYNEGETWPVQKTIYPGISGYSSLTVLPDGTIGLYYEVGEYETYQMYFVRFSLNWLSDGADGWMGPLSPIISSNDQPLVATPRFLVYPNPATDWVNVSGVFGAGEIIRVYSASGVLLREVPAGIAEGKVSFSIADLPAGTHLVNIGGETLMLIKQLVE